MSTDLSEGTTSAGSDIRFGLLMIFAGLLYEF